MTISFFNPLLKRINNKEESGESHYLPPPSNYLSLLQFIFLNFRKGIFVSLTMGALTSMTIFLTSMISAYVFDHIHESGLKTVTVQFLLFLCFIICSAMFSYINELLLKCLNVEIVHEIFSSLFRKLLSLPIASIKQIESGDLMQRISDYESSLSIIIKLNLSALFSMTTLMFLMIYMAWCYSVLAFCYLGSSIIFFLIKLLYFPLRVKYTTRQMTRQGKITSFLNEILLQIHKIRASNTEYRVFNHWLMKIIDVKTTSEKLLNLDILFSFLDSIVSVLLILSLYAILYFSSHPVNSILFLQFMICAGLFLVSMDKFTADVTLLIGFLPALQRLKFINEFSVSEKMASDEMIVNGGIIFSNVSFKHPLTHDLLLNDISFCIEPGKFAAFIGPSGSGKSTILKLILGLYQPCSGKTYIDNHDIRKTNIKNICKQFGVVLQTTNLLPGTIFSNISANSDITMDRAWELAKVVKLDEEISKMPMKMFTCISDNPGESISGGQKQKILIARALASKPKILLLDEATSALDNESQKHIHDHLQVLNITRIVVAHRLTTIANADMIFVIENGKILTSNLH